MGTIVDLNFATAADVGLLCTGTDNLTNQLGMSPKRVSIFGLIQQPAIVPFTIQADQKSEITFDMQGSTGGTNANCVLRYTDDLNHYLARMFQGKAEIYKKIGAALTLLSTTPVVQAYSALGTVQLFDVVGDNPANLELKVDGVSIGTASNSTVQLQTGPPGLVSVSVTHSLRKFRALSDLDVELFKTDPASKKSDFWIATVATDKKNVTVGNPGMIINERNLTGYLSNAYARGDGGGVEVVMNSTNPANFGIIITSGGAQFGYLIHVSSGTSLLVFRMESNTFVQIGGAITIPNIADGSDHTLKATLNGTTLEIFVDTVSQATPTMPAPIDIFVGGIRFANARAVVLLMTIKNYRLVGADDVAPTAPVIVASQGVGTNGIAISWNDPDGTDADVTKVKIERAPDVAGSPGTYATLAEWDKDMGDWEEIDPQSFLDDPGAGTFHYRVTFTDHDGNGTATLSGAIVSPFPSPDFSGPISIDLVVK